MSSQNPPRCPRCGSRLHRRHRWGLERAIGNLWNHRPYYCRLIHCEWQGWLPIPASTTRERVLTEPKPEFLTSAEIGQHDNWKPLG